MPLTTSTPPRESTVWTGSNLLSAFEFASHWLDRHRESINALNVFPVPDGDTGTNMAMTMRASVESALAMPDSASIGDVASRLAHGALMGARGNSGVILSQIFRGFANALADHDEMDSETLARSLQSASDLAYKAVLQPVEGTMLTVIREAARHALDSAGDDTPPIGVLQAALNGAREALAKTPEQLDILRQAGVVDAGGRGIVVILDGLCRFATGEPVIEEITEATPSESPGAGMTFLDDLGEIHGEEPFGYCTDFVIFGHDMPFDRIRERVAQMGQSVVIVGDSSVIKIHIHTENPGSVLEFALTFGDLGQIKIENMTRQADALAEQRAQAIGPTGTRQSHAPVIDGQIGVIAIAAGAGLTSALESMGAHRVVSGGQTMNPSTEELLDAVRQMPVDEIIILPNNKNIIMTAKQVGVLTDKEIRVIPSRSVPQGLAALARFSLDAALDDNAGRMTAALGDVHSIEITRAVRDAELEGIAVTAGSLIGLIDGDLMASGTDLADIVTRALRSLESAEPELLTVFTGEDATPDATAKIEQIAGEIFPDAEIETVDGGQPHYQYLIGVE